MDAELTPYIQTIEMLHDDLFRAVETLSDTEINWRHPHLSNTIGILLRHVAGSERFWILEVAGGRSIERHREREFGPEHLEKGPLVEGLRAAQAEVIQLLGSLRADDLTTELELTYRGETGRFTKAWAILHSIQHTAYHLGQIQLFRKMATSGQSGQLRPGHAG